MAGTSYRDLVVWQKAMDLAVAVYKATGRLPREERFGLSIQMRRSATSVPSNIAEGEGRRTARDFLQFLSISLGSLNELETQIELTRRLGFLPPDLTGPLDAQTAEVGRLINGLANSLRRGK